MQVLAKVCKYFEVFVGYYKAHDTFSSSHSPGGTNKYHGNLQWGQHSY